MMNAYTNKEVVSMKHIKAALVTVVACVAFSQGVSADARESWSLCKAEIKSLYGDDARLRLWNINNGRRGDRVRVVVIPKGEPRGSVSCNVTADGIASIVDNQNSEMLATTARRKHAAAQ